MQRKGWFPNFPIAPLLLFVVAFGVYWATLAPGITWAHEGADGGDLVTAAYTLGIPHPPGYPLYVLLGKLFSLLPLGSVAYRLNLMSALCAALAVVVFYFWVRAWLREAFPQSPTNLAATIAGLFLAFSRLFWSQAIIAEVYALNALLVAACLFLLWKWDRLPGERRAKVWALLAFVYGLSLGNHMTMVLLAPPALFYILTSPHRGRLGWQDILSAGACFLAGLALYLYLPLRAMARPFVNWGDPVTLDRFVWMVSGALYRHYLFALPIGHLPARLATLMGDLTRQFGPWGAALGLMGAWAVAERGRRQFLFTAGVFVLYCAYAVGYNTAGSFVYLIPAYMIWVAWIGHGLIFFFQLLEESWKGAVAFRKEILGLFLLLPLLSLLWNLPVLDLSNDREAHDYTEAVLTVLPPNAIVLSAADGHTFALWYAQQVEGRRPDILILDRDLLPYGWYRENIFPRYPQVAVPPADNGDSFGWLIRFLDENIARLPIFLTDRDERLMARYHAQPEGPLYRLTLR